MKVLALDIGGANIKAALGAVDGGAVSGIRATSVPFALWMEPERLTMMLRDVASGWEYDAIAVTMTGELCDCFANRREGVARILDAVGLFAERIPVGIWLTVGRFAAIDEAKERWLACASANWHAQAAWVARLFPLGVSLLIDTGSTTTDIVLLRDGELDSPGLTDMARLHGGLVYTGATRTPVMSLSPIRLASQMPGEEPVHLMAELFATMADVYLVTGDLLEEPRRCDTADGRPLTREASAARLLRMIGADAEVYLSMLAEQSESLVLAGIRAEEIPMRAAGEVARACALAQRDRIVDGIRRVRRAGCEGTGEPLVKVERVIVTGSGDFVAERAAEAALPGVQRVRLRDRMGAEASAAACAVALLHLWGLNPPAGVGGV